MREQPAPEQNRAIAVNPAPIPAMPWRVTSVRALDRMRLEVAFRDGATGVVDLSRLITSENAGVFMALKDEAYFQQACLELGAVSWPDGPDLAPDAMHRAIKADGVWKP